MDHLSIPQIPAQELDRGGSRVPGRETCEIVWVDQGGYKWRFAAQAISPYGIYCPAQSSVFGPSPAFQAAKTLFFLFALKTVPNKPMPHPKDPAATEAYSELIIQLSNRAWESVTFRGQQWWSNHFTRPATDRDMIRDELFVSEENKQMNWQCRKGHINSWERTSCRQCNLFPRHIVE